VGVTRPPGAGAFAAAVTEAYDATGTAWARGAARVYDRLAEALVGASPVPLAGRLVLDVGAGTGAAARAVARRGGRPVRLDRSAGMLRAGDGCSPRLVADATALPVADGSVDGAVAAFSLNHLPAPDAGLRAMRRACRTGSPLLASAYAADDDHPAKAAVERAATEAGWRPPLWYGELRASVVGQLATVDGMAVAARRAGVDGEVEHVHVTLDGLGPDDLVAWRLGMAQLAPFLATLGAPGRRRVARRARRLLGPTAPPLRRSLITLRAIV
jgi:SAM-dependent methyltransferase